MKLCIKYNVMLPVLQLCPVYPGAQVQVKVLSPSLQVPPLAQISLVQSSMSEIKFKINYSEY